MSKRNIMTMRQFLPTWNKNTLLNLQYADDAIKRYFGKCTGRKCILVGAGKSVDFHIDDIRTLSSAYDVFCADTISSTLVNAGVIVDGVFSLDATRHKYAHVSAAKHDSVLFMCPVIPPEISSLFKYHIGMTYGNPLQKRIDAVLGDVGLVNVSGAVGTIMLEAAISMGYDAILLYGLDMCLQDGQMYSSDVSFIRHPPSRFSSIEMGIAKHVSAYTPEHIVDYAGVTRKSTWPMARWVEWVASRAPTFYKSASIYAGTDRMARIPGVKCMDFSKFMDSYVPNDGRFIDVVTRPDRLSRVPELIDELLDSMLSNNIDDAFKWNRMLNIDVPIPLYVDILRDVRRRICDDTKSRCHSAH